MLALIGRPVRMRRVLPILLVGVLLSSCATVRQPDGSPEIASRQDAELMAYNVGFGAVVGAVGAALNG